MAKSEKTNNEGYNMLARAMQARMQRVGDTPPVLEFGVIQEDNSLLTNKFPKPIPQSDYFVCRQLTLGAKDDTLTTTKSGQGEHDHSDGSHGGHEGGSGSHTHDGGKHEHDVLIPEKMRKLKPGDHVLVAWVDADPVVIDIILPAKEEES